MEKEIKSIKISDNEGDYIVGKNSIIQITEHMPQGEGDKFFYDVKFEDGTVERHFDVKSVIFDHKDKEISF